MANKPSSIFSNGTEYEWFKEQFCERCLSHKERKDGFPDFPENGGCAIEDACEYARYDRKRFPSEWIRMLTDADDNVICWNYCVRFHNSDYEGVMVPYFKMMKDALKKKKDIEPKPCAFCGGKAIRKQIHFKPDIGEDVYTNEHHEDGTLKWSYLECDKCGRTTGAYCYEEQSTQAWNDGKAVIRDKQNK